MKSIVTVLASLLMIASANATDHSTGHTDAAAPTTTTTHAPTTTTTHAPVTTTTLAPVTTTTTTTTLEFSYDSNWRPLLADTGDKFDCAVFGNTCNSSCQGKNAAFNTTFIPNSKRA